MDSVLDARQLQAFVAVARTGSMTLAGQDLFLTPSAVSHAIHELEERVQCRLLDRRHKKVELTLAGEQLLNQARAILDQMASAKNSLSRLGKWGHDRVRVGANSAFCAHIFPEIVRQFYKRYPHCHLLIEAVDTLEALAMIRDNKIDFSIGLPPPPGSEVDFSPLFTDELVIMASAAHPLACKSSVAPSEISSQPFLLPKRNSLFSNLIQKHFHEQNVELNVAIDVGDCHAIKELIASNLGIGALPPWTVRQELRDRTIMAVPLLCKPLQFTWGFLRHPGQRLTLAEETLIAITRTALNQLKGGFPLAA